MYKLFAFECPNCGHTFDELVESVDEVIYCSACEEKCNLKWVAPSIRTSDSRTYLDGTRPGWNDVKEWAALDAAIDSAPCEDKVKIHKEASKIIGAQYV